MFTLVLRVTDNDTVTVGGNGISYLNGSTCTEESFLTRHCTITFTNPLRNRSLTIAYNNGVSSHAIRRNSSKKKVLEEREAFR